MNAKIEIRNVSKIFGPHNNRAIELMQSDLSKEDLLAQMNLHMGLKNISLAIHQGELFVVMGLSGSGKSTLIRTINRLIDVTTGSIVVDGENVTEMTPRELIHFRRFKISMVFQKFGLFPHKTVIANVAYGPSLQKKSAKECHEVAMHWIEKVGLSGYEKSFPRQLSGGMQQRVGLARALATSADILLMDEPFSALDPIFRTEMQDIVLRLQTDLKRTIVFITHDIDEALKLGSRIAILRDGEIQQVGTPNEIIDNPANEYVGRFVMKN